MMQIQEVEQSKVGENCLSGGLGFIGIRHRKWGKWGAEIRLCRSRRKIWLGSYNTPQQAALAYDAALFCLRGPNSQFNFPDSCNSISSSISSSSSRSSSRTCMSANEIKNFSRQYALQHGNAADAGDPPSSLQQQQQEDERINDDYRYEDASASAAESVAALAFSEVDRPCPWDLQNNVSWLQLELERDAMQFCNFTMEQHFNHENDTPDDDAYESEGSNCFQSIWSM